MKARLIGLVVVIALLVGGFLFFKKDSSAEPEVEYRYAKVEKGRISRSITATGQLVALTSVDVKSKAGGKVVELLVDEGAAVKAGQVIARIDPADTEAVYQQAQADLTSANARAGQAEGNLELQVSNAKTAVNEAKANLESAKIRLRRAQIEATRQPLVTKTTVATAQATYDAALGAYERLEKVEIPQRRRDVGGALNSAQVAYETASADLTRQEALLKKGFVSGSVVDRARTVAENAKAALANANQRASTLEQEIAVDLRAEKSNLARAKAALDQAKANTVQDDVSVASLEEAKKAVTNAEINVQKAEDNKMQVEIRRQEMIAAKSSIVRSRVSMDNAKVQLDSTTVVAPRDGVVTQKYLEEGTIIPPGMSTFAQGTSIVQISDVTQLFVECAVDEADIANVKIGQKVKILTEAFPGEPFDGMVTRVNPAAVTAANITAVKVRVKVLPGYKNRVLPGMNASCEFLTLEKLDVLTVPNQALKPGEDGEMTVRVKGADPKKPETRTVKVGESGNDSVEILSGLQEGDEVVTAEINLVEMRETQKKMLEAQQGGGFSMGGAPRGPTNRGGTGGARPGGAGGGGAGGGGMGGAGGAGARPGGGAGR